MKPSPFRYHDPRTIDEALGLLASLDNAKVLAGGQSLMPMMNLRYVHFDHVIDINRIPGMAGVSVAGGRLQIGAMTRQAHLLIDPEFNALAPIAVDALRLVGHIPTRNRGTIGGSVVHMDPAAELMGLTALHDGILIARSKRGERKIAVADWSLGFMTPALEPDEVLVEIQWSAWPRFHGRAFYEFSQRHGDFAIVGVGAVLCLADDRKTISRAGIVLIGVGFAPIRLLDAERALAGQPATSATFRAAAEIAGRVDAMRDAMISSQYRQRLSRVLTSRALAAAATDAVRRMKEMPHA